MGSQLHTRHHIKVESVGIGSVVSAVQGVVRHGGVNGSKAEDHGGGDLPSRNTQTSPHDASDFAAFKDAHLAAVS